MAALGFCKQKGCQVATTGQCVEGFKTVETCPHFQAKVAALVDAPAAPLTKTKAVLENPLDLPSGKELSAAQASDLLRVEGGTVIALAGDEDVGKTTLIATLFDRFQDGPCAGLRFAGSETLVGFELRCHDARTSSGRPSQETQRTSRKAPLHFLHLRLSRDGQKTGSRERCNLLVSDLSGEWFKLAADKQDECRKMKHFSHADRVALCVDGEKLVDLKERQGCAAVATGLLSNLLATELLDQSSIVDVLITKWDKVERDAKANMHKSFVSQVELKLKADFADRLASLRFFRVAARPDEGSPLPLGYQLDELLAAWLTPRAQLPAPPMRFQEPSNLRESERYLRRRLPQYFEPEEA